MSVDELEYLKSLSSKFQDFQLFKSVLLKPKGKDIKLLLATSGHFYQK